MELYRADYKVKNVTKKLVERENPNELCSNTEDSLVGFLVQWFLDKLQLEARWCGTTELTKLKYCQECPARGRGLEHLASSIVKRDDQTHHKHFLKESN